MVERKTSTRRYLTAGVITILIFLVGLFIGTTLTNIRADAISIANQEQRLDIESSQLQYTLLTRLTEREEGCDAALATLGVNINSLEDTRRKLESYIASSLTENAEFNTLKREYMIAEIRYWLLAQETQKLCGKNFVTLLYFYSNDGCIDCVAQGNILTNLKDTFEENLLIFSIDADFSEEPMIRILTQTFGVKEYPAIILQGEKYEGLQTETELKPKICEEFTTQPEICNE